MTTHDPRSVAHIVIAHPGGRVSRYWFGDVGQKAIQVNTDYTDYGTDYTDENSMALRARKTSNTAESAFNSFPCNL